MAKTPTPTTTPTPETATTAPATDRLSTARHLLATREHALAEAQAALQELQTAATSAALHARDLDALVAQGVLLRSDPDVIQAQQAAAEAKAKLLAARDAVQRAQAAHDALVFQVEQERRRAWALEHDPSLASALAELEAAQARSGDPLPGENRFEWRRREANTVGFKRGLQIRLHEAMKQAPAAPTDTD